MTGADDELGVTVRTVPEAEWTHGEAKVACGQPSLVDAQPLVEVATGRTTPTSPGR